MNKNIFGFKDPVSYSESITAKRENKIYNGIQNALQEHYTNRVLEEEQKQAEVEFRNNTLFETPEIVSKLQKRNQLLEEQRIRAQLTDFFKATFLSEAIYNAIPINDDFIVANESVLKDKFRKFLIENKEVTNLDNFENSTLVLEHVSDEIAELVESVMENTDKININEDSELLAVYNEANKNNSNIADEIASMVKEKVMETLDKEKEKAKSNKKAQKEVDEKKKADDEEVYGDDESLDTDTSDEELEDTEDSEDLDDDTSEDDLDTSDDESDLDDDTSDEELDNAEDDEDLDISDDLDIDGDGVDDNEQLESEVDDTDDFKDESEIEEEVIKGNYKFTITTDSPNFTITAEQLSEDANYYLSGIKKYRNDIYSKSLFRHILESTLEEYSATNALNESPISMDIVYSEAIINLCLLETLYTTKLIQMSKPQREALLYKLK